MNRYLDSLRRFMYGRYGFDQLSRGLIILALIISVISSFLRFPYLVLLSYLPLAYAIYRTLSKNIARRTKENITYCRITGNVKKKMNNLKLILIGTKTHKYYKCRRCKQTIRVPRNKGKICITCPKCRSEFIKRT